MGEPWYSAFGFSSNPFNTKPASLTNEMVGIHIEPILEKVENGEIQFIEAPLGSGKTTILKSIISAFGGKRKLIYASCIKNECLEVESILKNATFRGKLFGALPKGMILLVDEAQNISKEDAHEITKYAEQGNITSVAFFGIQYHKKLLTDKLNESLNGNITVLSYLTPEEAVEIVRKRIGNIKLMPDYVIREAYARSNSNPRKLLQNCEDLCRKAAELSIKELTITDVAMLLKPETIQKKRRIKAGRKKAKHAPKERKGKAAKAAKKQGEEPETATITYSGYNLENIRTYDEELPRMKEHERI